LGRLVIFSTNKVVFFKFLEVSFRALAVIFAAYTLDAYEAGQFGLIVTLQGFSSFFFGFERHIDIQRRYVGESAEIFDSAVRSTFLVFFTNYIIFSPLYLLGLNLSAEIYSYALAVCLVIAVIEQLMNFAYQLALVNQRYVRFLYLACAKNITFFVLLVFLWLQQRLNLDAILITWAISAIIFAIIMSVSWLLIARPAGPARSKAKSIKVLLVAQYQISSAHFFIGFVAMLVLQLDRLIIGLVLPLDSVGVYFRHVLVVSLVYQVFNIASYNRILPDIFRLAKTESIVRVREQVAKEYRNILVFIVLLICLAGSLHLIKDGIVFERFNISPLLMLGLLLASGVRVRADLNSLVFHALYREDVVLKMQLFMLLVSCCLLTSFTLYFGIVGAVLAAGVAAVSYVVLSFVNLNRFSNSSVNS
jgi:O-antigen/teichoic acid export membrane protein